MELNNKVTTNKTLELAITASFKSQNGSMYLGTFPVIEKSLSIFNISIQTESRYSLTTLTERSKTPAFSKSTKSIPITSISYLTLTSSSDKSIFNNPTYKTQYSTVIPTAQSFIAETIKTLSLTPSIPSEPIFTTSTSTQETSITLNATAISLSTSKPTMLSFDASLSPEPSSTALKSTTLSVNVSNTKSPSSIEPTATTQKSGTPNQKLYFSTLPTPSYTSSSQRIPSSNMQSATASPLMISTSTALLLITKLSTTLSNTTTLYSSALHTKIRTYTTSFSTALLSNASTLQIPSSIVPTPTRQISSTLALTNPSSSAARSTTPTSSPLLSTTPPIYSATLPFKSDNKHTDVESATDIMSSFIMTNSIFSSADSISSLIPASNNSPTTSLEIPLPEIQASPHLRAPTEIIGQTSIASP